MNIKLWKRQILNLKNNKETLSKRFISLACLPCRFLSVLWKIGKKTAVQCQVFLQFQQNKKDISFWVTACALGTTCQLFRIVLLGVLLGKQVEAFLIHQKICKVEVGTLLFAGFSKNSLNTAWSVQKKFRTKTCLDKGGFASLCASICCSFSCNLARRKRRQIENLVCRVLFADNAGGAPFGSGRQPRTPPSSRAVFTYQRIANGAERELHMESCWTMSGIWASVWRGSPSPNGVKGGVWKGKIILSRRSSGSQCRSGLGNWEHHSWRARVWESRGLTFLTVIVCCL